MSKLKGFIAEQITLKPTASGVQAIREGQRSILSDAHNGYSLGKIISGQLPYHYRTIPNIASDFTSGTSALEAVLALATCMPTSPKFMNSHCGEITAAHFIEDQLGFRRLYSKLTMITSQSTNAHKMDGLFVDTSKSDYQYLFVEAKSSILPTLKTPTKSHKSGILKQMLTSLSNYANEDPRFELSRIRDNLEKSFSDQEALRIKKDLMPPGPIALKFLGISVTNAATVNTNDDDFILSELCNTQFDYHALVVTDLEALTTESYGYWSAMKAAVP